MRNGDHITVPGYVTGWLLAHKCTPAEKYLEIEPDGWPGYIRFLKLPPAYRIEVDLGPTDADIRDLESLAHGDAWNQLLGGSK